MLGLEKEPFSTSPDPDFFYLSSEHNSALTRVMIDIRLRRGLSLILGDIGTGKTTLSRKLFQMLAERQDIIFHMVLDPTYDTEEIFLDSLIRTLGIQPPCPEPNILDYKTAIKDYLFARCVNENKTVVLLIDESQKLNPLSLEVLRILLNYETNEYKLLQLVLMAQLDILPKIKQIRNLLERISLKYIINPLDEKETKEMIGFRIKKAGYNSSLPLFTDAAVLEIYRYTQGYPRRIAMLCHNALKTLVMDSKEVVDEDIIHSLIAHESSVMTEAQAK